MKIKFVSAGIIVGALCGGFYCSAQTTNTNNYSNNYLRDRSDNDMANGHHLGKLEKSSTLIGMRINDAQGEKIGKVKDLAIDLQNGRILEVIVGTGGLAGVDEHYSAVPPGQFSCDAANKALVLNSDKQRFTSSPAFKMANWEESVNQGNAAEVYQYYDASPYFKSDEMRGERGGDWNRTNQMHNSAMANNNSQNNDQMRTNYMRSGSIGEIRRASQLVGTSVRNSQDQKLGKIENLIVDLPAGRVVEVVVSSGGFLGMGDELSDVPPQSFSRGTDSAGTDRSDRELVLDTTKENLATAPHFKSHEWPDLNKPDYNHYNAVYHAYNVNPYFTTNDVDNTSQNVRDRQDNTMTPMNQGNSQADIDTTSNIRKQIMAVQGLSVNAQNVKVITRDGRVTLRGPVNSENEKQQIGNIANSVATQANVDNQLQVKGTSNINDSMK